MAKLGFLGLGLMGQSMARRLLQAGHEVALWSHTAGKAEKLAAEGKGTACGSPAEVASKAECVFLCVGDTAMSREVLLGNHSVIEGAGPGRETLDAISKADMITIGPGSLFTSLIPNLLVHGIPEAIAASRAIKVYVCNLMTQANESLGLTASDHIRKLYEHAGVPIFDYALLNTAPISESLQAKYALEGASRIVVDRDAIEGLGVRCVTGNFVAEDNVVRHATDRVAAELLKLAAGAKSA